MNSPHNFLFLFLIISSTCIVLSSSNWLITWIGLEINMLGFIPLMLLNETPNESETIVNYLVPQSLGSTLFIASTVVSAYLNGLQTLIPIAICLNLGAAPLHFWFPPVIAGLSLSPAFILLTWQNIAPMFAINSLDPSLVPSVLPIALISALWGGIGGLNQTDIRTLLTYSSIAHTGWILTSIMGNAPTLIAYILIYILINISLYTCLVNNSTNLHKQLFSLEQPFNSFLLAVSILSLAGLPPFAGFMINLLVLYHTNASLLIISGLILGAIVSLFFYLSLTFSPLIEVTNMRLTNTQVISNPLIIFFLSQTLPLSFFLFLF